MLNIVASFFRFTIPPSKNDVLQRKTRTKQKCFSLHGNNVPLFFAIHPSGCNDGEKAKQEYSAEDCVNIKVTSNDGVKTQQKYSLEDCAATMFMDNDGLKAQQEYSAEDCAAIMVTSKDGAKSQRDYSPGYHPGFEFIN